MSVATPVTADQLLNMPRGTRRYELIAGELKTMSPASWRHGSVAGRISSRLAENVERHNLGVTFIAETGFLLARDPDTVRAPDAAFIRKDHLPAQPPREAFWPGAPDLAVEVVSPGDTVSEVDETVKAWLDAGAMMVWVANPKWQTITVYRSATDIKVLTAGDELTGDHVVAGFSCPVAEIFRQEIA
jgi:Uma2 family endonuclease